jgi:tetratricopeptide (TPR) repeat protein
MSEDRRGDNVDYILQHLEQSNKRASLLTYFVGIVVMLIFASSFYFTIESLNYKLTAQLQENQETLERVSTLETQLKNIGQILYESNEITESSIRNKEVENLIAKDANRRQITNEERVSLNEFSTQEVTEYKATNNIMAAFEKLDQDKTEEALVLINKAIEQSANSAVAYTLKAEVLNNQKKHVEAISAQTKAIELEKGNIFSSLIPNFYNTRGFLYLEIDDIDNAIKDFETG